MQLCYSWRMRAGLWGLLLWVGACSASGTTQSLELPSVPEAKSAILFIDDGATIELIALDLGDPSTLRRELLPAAQRLITFVAFRADLDELGSNAGAIHTPPSSRPMPPFIAAFATRFADGLLSDWMELGELGERVSSELYAEGCRFSETETGQLCLPNRCPGACQRALCWSAPVAWSALDSGTGDDGITAVQEEGELWFYFSTHRWTSTSSSSRGRGDHARVRLLDPVTPDLSTLDRIPNIDRADLESIGRPTVSFDGRELWFQGNIVNGRRESLRAYRTTASGPWMGAEIALPGLDTTKIDDPVLLPDRRTVLVYLGASLGEALTVMARPTAEVGNLGFDLVSATPRVFGEDADATVSCDGFHLLYVFDQEAEPIPSAIPILAMSPLEFGQRVALTGIPSRLDGEKIAAIGESPDCSTLYLSNGQRIYYANRQPCAE